MLILKPFFLGLMSTLICTSLIPCLVWRVYGFSWSQPSVLTHRVFHRRSNLPQTRFHAQFPSRNSRQILSPVITATVNDNVDDDSASQKEQKYVKFDDLNPTNVLYPWLRQKENERMTLDNAINLMIKAIESLDEAHFRQDGDVDVLRITQHLSHVVDPLAWLDSQRIINLGNANNYDCDSSISKGYFGNVEETQEAAFLGSVRTFHHLLANNHIADPDSTTSNNDSVKKHDLEWEWIQSNVPFESRIYGASKFDTSSTMTDDKNQNLYSSEPGNEWNAFLPSNDNDITGVWVLPALELRRFQSKNREEMTLSVHITLDRSDTTSNNGSNIRQILHILRQLSSTLTDDSPNLPNMPPIVSRTYHPSLDDGPFEHGIEAALKMFEDPTEDLQKTVMARRADLHFASEAGDVRGIDIVKRLKYGGQHVGHLFYIQSSNDENVEFLSGTPERLFSICPENQDKTDKGIYNGDSETSHQQKQWTVSSEALAGTRPRGSTSEADEDLLKELIHSEKDKAENMITGQFIKNIFVDLQKEGKLRDLSLNENNDNEGFFIRRLAHLQHICQIVRGKLVDPNDTIEVAKTLLNKLHPTPAVCGFPSSNALNVIKTYESRAFDRGFYAGPSGFIGKESSDVIVAIRSGLFVKSKKDSLLDNSNEKNEKINRNSKYDAENGSVLHIYAGAGIVPGSTVQGEWIETTQKLGVLSSQFFPSPLNLQSLVNPNVAWATVFIEELIRSGITQFYICPGSRSTPLTAAMARAMKSHVGTLRAVSVHDERAAAFRALGYARSNDRAAAVITSSGTAVANLYPAVMEAGLDGVPLLLLTADRPYESRDNGSNQSVDQVKVFSPTYVRWFRDIPPPNDDVPVSLALSDASHAVAMTKDLRGPVHLNIQFRENLAPDTGPIRNDNRIGSVTKFDSDRFTDVPGFSRWAVSGSKWLKSYSPQFVSNSNAGNAVYDVFDLIKKSKRGMIVVGNIRGVVADKNAPSNVSSVAALISDFAQKIGFPVFAGAQSAYLRYECTSVVPYGEYVLKHPSIKSNLKPDLIIQIGNPLISTEISGLIYDTMKNVRGAHHILVHPHHPNERSDPTFTVTHRISSDISSFVQYIQDCFDRFDDGNTALVGSDLAPLVVVGRHLAANMPSIIHSASNKVIDKRKKIWEEGDVEKNERGYVNDKSITTLTEPQVVLALSEIITENCQNQEFSSLFLSNSMPVRDAEFFLYPPNSYFSSPFIRSQFAVSVNRGASGIDGIISTATGHAEASNLPTTLLIGDLATLHDLNSFHNLAKSSSLPSAKNSQLSLTTVIVNNNGGGIFSFLPISQYGDDVGFEDFFGTPTNSFSFAKGSEAFGVPFNSTNSYIEFKEAYRKSLLEKDVGIIEAQVLGRDENVEVHKEITKITQGVLDEFLKKALFPADDQFLSSKEHIKLPARFYHEDENMLSERSTESIQTHKSKRVNKEKKNLILLHGWLGDKSEWDSVATSMMDQLSQDWNIISIDLPGHGESPLLHSEENHLLRDSFGTIDSHIKEKKKSNVENEQMEYSVDSLAKSVLVSLMLDYDIKRIDALCGYSLGGRVALAMKRLSTLHLSSTEYITQNSLSNSMKQAFELVTDETKFVLLGSYLGEPHGKDGYENTFQERMRNDDTLSEKMRIISNKSLLTNLSKTKLHNEQWAEFVSNWYDSPLWGSLEKRMPSIFNSMVNKRVDALLYRGNDMARILSGCSPPRNSISDWRYIVPSNTIFLSGKLDKKYSKIGKQFEEILTDMRFVEIPDAGHALLLDQHEIVSETISNFLSKDDIIQTTHHYDLRTDHIINEKVQSESVKSYTPQTSSKISVDIKSLDLELFSIPLIGNKKSKGIFGIGWSDESKKQVIDERRGVVISLSSSNDYFVGMGEVSPLPGLHLESLEQAKGQLRFIQRKLLETNEANLPAFEAQKVLSLDGSLKKYLHLLAQSIGLETEYGSKEFFPSVYSGLEMSILSVASMALDQPLPKALVNFSSHRTNHNEDTISEDLSIPLNGLVTKGSHETKTKSRNKDSNSIKFPSMKIKIGDNPMKDPMKIFDAITEQGDNKRNQKVRADANRAWDMKTALKFASALRSSYPDFKAHLEFIEEPLSTKENRNTLWTPELQINKLEEWYECTEIPYAIDETLADMIFAENFNFTSISNQLLQIFKSGNENKGCAALVLKPSIIGFELSMQLAKLAHTELGVGAVFSSCIDSGVGLAYNAFFAATVDHLFPTKKSQKYPHGIGTFTMLANDALSPPFSSYVDEGGILKVSSLAKDLWGLDIEDMKDSFASGLEDYDRKSSTQSRKSSKSRKISVSAEIPLPFSDKVACDRFTDLPQQPRWCPWVKSVTYLDSNGQSEWALNIRGSIIRWKATSKLLNEPKGIMWESVSGLKNQGYVEFIKTSDDSCLMRVKIDVIVPPILAVMYRSIDELARDFIEQKLLKWSLESFRDVIKADLALERGDKDLGDALFGAVEGRNFAIEATLLFSRGKDKN